MARAIVVLLLLTQAVACASPPPTPTAQAAPPAPTAATAAGLASPTPAPSPATATAPPAPTSAPAATASPTAPPASAATPSPPPPAAARTPAPTTTATVRTARFPAGPFTMGRDDGPADERPAHTVPLGPFEVDVLPVTNRQFAAFLEAVGPTARGQALFDADDADARVHRVDGRWRADPGVEEHPVYEASWFGAREYCLWRGARLPTEAEWERAARGTAGRPYPWGDAPPDPTRARFGAGWRDSLPVGSLPAGATPEGLLDLAGNEWEWTSSLYRPYAYRADDGREEPTSREERVTRGGGQDSPADHLRTTYRGRGLSRGPAAGHHNIGFRCARDGA